MPDIRAELIEGIVYMASPVSQRKHGKPHFLIGTWLGNYNALTPGTEGGDNSTLRLDLDNEPQPDLFLMIAAESGGRAKIDNDDYVSGAPELIIEVSASSVSYDLHEKLRAYRRNGVNEYLVWRTLDQAFDWFVLNEGEYQRLDADETGILKSRIFHGLWLDAAALLRGDMKQVLTTLQLGLGTAEHAAFIASLREKVKR